MPFDSGSLLRAASGLSADLAAGRKLTRHHVTISPPEAIDPAGIVAIRNRLDMSQSEFASVLGVTPASVMNWVWPQDPLRAGQTAAPHRLPATGNFAGYQVNLA